MLRKACLTGFVVLLVSAPTAQAAIPSSLASSCQTKPVAEAGYSFKLCDDGLPPVGAAGATPNVGAVNAVPVPAKYDGFEGLPDAAPDAGSAPGADGSGNVALDVDISMPTTAAPPGGYPLLVMMHGCCNGTKMSWESRPAVATDPWSMEPNPGGLFGKDTWHYNNVWFAARGYVVVNYTARGFFQGTAVTKQGSTGEAQLDSRRYEMNDMQSLAGQIADEPTFQVNPSKVIATGGSYGGGFSWMALTDPKWESPGGKDVSLAAVAPKYGWTDLLYSLVPNGHHSASPTAAPATDGTTTTTPAGTGKSSVVGILYGLGTGFLGGGTTFPASFPSDKACIDNGDPIDTDSLCVGTLSRLGDFINDRSAYYQTEFFDKIKADPSYRVPVFAYVPWTDPLFTPIEDLRMYNRLKKDVPNYPVQMVFGASTPHFAQDKQSEWGDLCTGDSGTADDEPGDQRHVCRIRNNDYYSNNVDKRPRSYRRTGITSRLNDFIDHYARPSANSHQGKPRFISLASLEVCKETGAAKPALPGREFRASTFERLARRNLNVTMTGNQTTTNTVTGNLHSVDAEPLNRIGKCVSDTTPAEPGVAVYTSAPLARDVTMIGLPKVTVNFNATSSTNLQLNTRLYDVLPTPLAGVTQVMADRGPYRVSPGTTSGPRTFELYGNGWRFEKGHRIRIEIAQDDDQPGPIATALGSKGSFTGSGIPSSTTISGVTLSLPTRESSPALTGTAGP